ncbi:hypothetical protein SMC26_39750 [Actinomadura fulvescens]|uniref:Uncharacterized protein n=1 Tax=Actinomadura fulvescens TaxID=46160 RepID=A0ABN3QKL2_9ACTN
MTNSVNQGAGAIHVLVESYTDQMFEIAVWDNVSGRPELQPVDFVADGGRDLHILDSYSVAWWVTASPDGGKTVRARFIEGDE